MITFAWHGGQNLLVVIDHVKKEAVGVELRAIHAAGFKGDADGFRRALPRFEMPRQQVQRAAVDMRQEMRLLAGGRR